VEEDFLAGDYRKRYSALKLMMKKFHSANLLKIDNQGAIQREEERQKEVKMETETETEKEMEKKEMKKTLIVELKKNVRNSWKNVKKQRIQEKCLTNAHHHQKAVKDRTVVKMEEEMEEHLDQKKKENCSNKLKTSRKEKRNIWNWMMTRRLKWQRNVDKNLILV